MNKQEAVKALQTIRKISQKRNFKQSIDLIMNLKGLDLKKPDHNVNAFVSLHYSRGKKVKVGALVDAELLEQAKKVCDIVVSVDDFQKYKDKRAVKKLADSCDFFIAQANVMSKVAATFGRVFGPKGKMPNPKAGCVVPPNANLKDLYERLQKLLHLRTKNDPIVQCVVGSEDMPDEQLIDNIMTVYNSVIHTLPNEKHNVKDVYLKCTMGKSAKVGEEYKETEKKVKKKPAEKKEETKSEEKSEEKKSKEPKAEEKKEEQPKPAEEKVEAK